MYHRLQPITGTAKLKFCLTCSHTSFWIFNSLKLKYLRLSFSRILSPKNSKTIPCFLFSQSSMLSPKIWNRPQDKCFYYDYFIFKRLWSVLEKAFLINVRIHKPKIFAHLKPFLLLLSEKRETERKKENHKLIFKKAFDHRSTRQYICPVFTFHRSLLYLISSLQMYKACKLAVSLTCKITPAPLLSTSKFIYFPKTSANPPKLLARACCCFPPASRNQAWWEEVLRKTTQQIKDWSRRGFRDNASFLIFTNFSTRWMWLSVSLLHGCLCLELEKNTKTAADTCSDRLVNLNFIPYRQIFLTHFPLSFPAAVTMYLFVIQMSQVGASQTCCSHPALSQYIKSLQLPQCYQLCACSAAESPTYTSANLQKPQSNEVSSKKECFLVEKSKAAKLYFTLP